MGLPNWRVGLAVYGFRVCNALVSRTFFQPDEYYQSLEVAHRIVFGYGCQTWEWRPTAGEGGGGIRSPLYPFLFVPGYWLLKQLQLDQTQLLIILPKLVQAAIAATTDIATYSLASRLLSPAYAAAALACSLTSFFNLYAGIRTFSNSLETALTAVALTHWPWPNNNNNNTHHHQHQHHHQSNLPIPVAVSIAVALISTTAIVRPPSLLLWGPLTLSTLRNSSSLNSSIDLIALFCVIGTISALVCFLIDSSYYGSPTFTPINFLRKNLLNNLSSFYGSNSWHFYFSQAFPIVNLTMFPTVILGIRSLATSGSILEEPTKLLALRSARSTILSTMAALSLINHKELRFIQPLVPLFNCFAARIMVNTYSNYRQQHPLINPNQAPFLERLLRSRPQGFLFRSIISLGLGFYLLRYHYQAQVSVMGFLRQLPNDQLHSIGFLMPCHSTPWQSHLHKPHLAPNGTEERLWMLTCEPPRKQPYSINDKKATEPMEALNKDEPGKQVAEAESSSHDHQQQEPNKYQDEADEFYQDALYFLQTKFPDHVDEAFPATTTIPRRGETHEHPGAFERQFQWPSHIVIFEALWKLLPVRNLLQHKGYTVLWSHRNSLWHDDPVRRAGNVMVLHWSPSSSR